MARLQQALHTGDTRGAAWAGPQDWLSQVASKLPERCGQAPMGSLPSGYKLTEQPLWAAHRWLSGAPAAGSDRQLMPWDRGTPLLPRTAAPRQANSPSLLHHFQENEGQSYQALGTGWGRGTHGPYRELHPKHFLHQEQPLVCGSREGVSTQPLLSSGTGRGGEAGAEVVSMQWGRVQRPPGGRVLWLLLECRVWWATEDKWLNLSEHRFCRGDRDDVLVRVTSAALVLTLLAPLGRSLPCPTSRPGGPRLAQTPSSLLSLSMGSLVPLQVTPKWETIPDAAGASEPKAALGRGV